MSQAGAAESDPYLDLPPEVFIKRLAPHEQVLLDLKEQLYEGSWERILEDLKARAENKPYLYKLSAAIARDLAAIERMQTYERRRGVNLAQLLKEGKS